MDRDTPDPQAPPAASLVRAAPVRAAIVQSCYIPWKGYFDLIGAVDEFIFLDDVQYTRRDWRNRNRIKTPQGAAWLSIPVEVSGKYTQAICETRASDDAWRRKHWETLARCYARAEFFKPCREWIEELYLGSGERSLTRINYRFTRAICERLGLATRLSFSMDYEAPAEKTDRLVALCRRVGAAVYLSGPAARAYLDEGRFAAEGITVEYMDYSGYPAYRQLFPPFDHFVTVLDLILNEGPGAGRFMKFGARVGEEAAR